MTYTDTEICQALGNNLPPACGEHSSSTSKSKFILLPHVTLIPKSGQEHEPYDQEHVPAATQLEPVLDSDTTCLFAIIKYRRMLDDTFPLVASKVGTIGNKYPQCLK